MFNKKKTTTFYLQYYQPGYKGWFRCRRRRGIPCFFGYEKDRKQQYMSFGIIVSQYTLQKRIGETLDNRYIIIMGIPFR